MKMRSECSDASSPDPIRVTIRDNQKMTLAKRGVWSDNNVNIVVGDAALLRHGLDSAAGVNDYC